MTTVDIAVIGAGPAGLEIMKAMKDSPYSMICIERGSSAFNLEDQRRFCFESVGRTIRSGPLKTLHDAEHHLVRATGFGGTYSIWGRIWKALTPRDFLGWPFSYEELLPYYRESALHHHVLETLNAPEIQCKVEKGFENPNLADDFEQVKHTLLLNSACIGFNIDQTKVEEIIINNNGVRTQVRARVYILATGTIETTRLLLNQPELQHPLLGKYLMDHPKGFCGTLIPMENASPFLLIKKGHKELKQGFSIDHPQLPHHCVLFKKNPQGFAMRFHLEQLPNFESQITLSDQLDENALPIPILDWRFMESEAELFKRTFHEIKKELERQRIGTVIYDDKELSLEAFTDASHQMGTTRMGKTVSEGVVDPHLKVYGTDNLYVASNSVFPTAGNANPTLTLLALTRRLADHLKTKIDRG